MKKKLIVILFSIFIASLPILYYYLLPSIASFLIFGTNLHHADVIIVLGGDEERIPYGIKLYKLNYSDKIVISGEDLAKKQMLDLGSVAKDVILENKSTTTYENAKFTRNIMLKNNFKSAIVVSSPYHMRRVSWLFNNVFKNDNITLFYSPVEDSWFKSDKWWMNEKGRDIVIEEYAKFIYYDFYLLKNKENK